MNLFDEFYNVCYHGKKPQFLDKDNLETFAQEKGEEWLDGYLKAMETVAIQLSDILIPHDSVGGIARKAPVVTRMLRDYWFQNKDTIIAISSHIESSRGVEHSPPSV